MAIWVEDRWMVTVRNADGSTSQRRAARYGTGRRWRVRYETPDGAERSKSFDRKPDADRFRTQTGADMLRGTYLDPDAGKMTLRKYAEHWLAIQTFDDVTRERTTLRVSHILGEPGDRNALGGKRLDQIAAMPSIIQAWVKGLRLAPSTAALCLSTLSSIFIAAIDDGKVTRNPCKARSVRAPKQEERKVVPLEADQLAALREALPPRYRAMIEAGAKCGLRQGEIFGLAADDIDFLRRTIYVRRQVKQVGEGLTFALPKRGKTRTVPLGPAEAVVFAEHIREYRPVPVTLRWHQPGNRLHGRTGTVALMFTTPQARGAVKRNRFNTDTWKPALRRAGIPDTRENGMHVLRHSFASLLLAAGVDIKRVAGCLGHANAAFTLRVYTHLMQGGEEQVRRALDAASTGPTPAPRLQAVT